MGRFEGKRGGMVTLMHQVHSVYMYARPSQVKQQGSSAAVHPNLSPIGTQVCRPLPVMRREQRTLANPVALPEATAAKREDAMLAYSGYAWRRAQLRQHGVSKVL